MAQASASILPHSVLASHNCRRSSCRHHGNNVFIEQGSSVHPRIATARARAPPRPRSRRRQLKPPDIVGTPIPNRSYWIPLP